jgi:hypothetical protein
MSFVVEGHSENALSNFELETLNGSWMRISGRTQHQFAAFQNIDEQESQGTTSATSFTALSSRGEWENPDRNSPQNRQNRIVIDSVRATGARPGISCLRLPLRGRSHNLKVFRHLPIEQSSFGMGFDRKGLWVHKS